MSRRGIHRVNQKRERHWGKPMWHAWCTCGWFQWVFHKSECQQLGTEHLARNN